MAANPSLLVIHAIDRWPFWRWATSGGYRLEGLRRMGVSCPVHDAGTSAFVATPGSRRGAIGLSTGVLTCPRDVPGLTKRLSVRSN
jgi:hypothetical protein